MQEDHWFEEAENASLFENADEKVASLRALKLGAWDLRFGRGWVALGALCTLISFGIPVFQVHGYEERMLSALLLSMHASQLWNIPVVACVLIYVLFTRRTAPTMLRARIAVIFLGCVPLLSLLHMWWSMRHRFDEMDHKLGVKLYVSPSLGLVVVLVSALFVAYGAYRFRDAKFAIAEADTE